MHRAVSPVDEERLAHISQFERLPKREQEIVTLMLNGNNVPDISRKFFISENTVRGHLKIIYREGIHPRQEFVDALSAAKDQTTCFMGCDA